MEAEAYEVFRWALACRCRRPRERLALRGELRGDGPRRCASLGPTVFCSGTLKVWCVVVIHIPIYVHMYIYIYTYMYIYIYRYMCVYVYIYIKVFTCMYVYMCVESVYWFASLLVYLRNTVVEVVCRIHVLLACKEYEQWMTCEVCLN